MVIMLRKSDEPFSNDDNYKGSEDKVSNDDNDNDDDNDDNDNDDTYADDDDDDEVLEKQEGTLLAHILSGERASLDTPGTGGLTRGLGTTVSRDSYVHFLGDFEPFSMESNHSRSLSTKMVL